MNKITGLYVITDQDIYPGRTHLDIAKAAIDGGAKIIQLRDKTSTDLDFHESALQIKKLTLNTDVIFIVNDRVHIAAAVGADGVNIGQNDMPIADARKILGKDSIIGISATNIDEAIKAESDGANYIGFGPIFHTNTKTDAAPETGLTMLEFVCKTVNIPVVAIGGINLNNIDKIAQAGADCASVVSAVVCADDMKLAVISLINKFKSKLLNH